MHKLSIAVTCLALAAGGLAACGGDDDDDGGEATTPAATQTSGGTGAATGGIKVSMKDIKYIPEQVTARTGQKITWTNNDAVAHTVTAKSGAGFDSGTIQPGGKYSQTMSKAGKIDYVCTIHPNQTGTITVQ
jgi:plastocyanin